MTTTPTAAARSAARPLSATRSTWCGRPAALVVRDNFFGRSEEVDPTKHLAVDVRNTKRVVIRDNVQADWGFQDYFYAINNDSVDAGNNKRQNGTMVPVIT